MSELQRIKLEDLRIEERCQARAELNPEAVEHYADLYKHEGGGPLPPIEVVNVDGTLVIVDGFHRHEAAKQAGLDDIECKIIKSGNLDFAAWTALSKNTKHGVRRSSADKRKAVELALDHGIGKDKSSRAIAKHLGVSHTLVDNIKAKREMNAEAAAAEGGNSATQEPDAKAGADIRTPEQADTAPEATPVAEDQDIDQAEAITEGAPAEDYRAAEKKLQRVWNDLTERLGSADPVCAKVNEAIRLAKQRAADTATSKQQEAA